MNENWNWIGIRIENEITWDGQKQGESESEARKFPREMLPSYFTCTYSDFIGSR